MRIILFLLFAVAFLGALVVERNEQSAVHQIYAAIGFLTAAVLLVGAAIVDALVHLPDRLIKRLKQASTPPSTARPTPPREPVVQREPTMPREPTLNENTIAPIRRK